MKKKLMHYYDHHFILFYFIFKLIYKYLSITCNKTNLKKMLNHGKKSKIMNIQILITKKL